MPQVPQDRICVRTALALVLWAQMGLLGCDGPSHPNVNSVAPESTRDEAVVKPAPQLPQRERKRIDVEPNQAVSRIDQPQQIFRPDDQRPSHDDSRLAELGIRVFESKRLKLYSDIDAKLAQSLPELIDQIYVDWESELGPLPPDRAGTEFQITGYLIQNMALFRELQLIPEEVTYEHGRNLGNVFWMQEQRYDYFRRHLLIHEATHCFMTFMPEIRAPLWYLEGMAEYFGTHRINNNGQATFRIMPSSEEEVPGFGRIKLIRDDIAANHFQTISSLFAFQSADFRQIKYYAWSWAFCIFLDQHPTYHDRFRKLSGFTHGNQFLRQFEEMFQTDGRALATEWTLFSANLQHGYDIVRAAIDFRPGTTLSDEQSERSVQIAADRGWQSSEVLLEAGQSYEIIATGEFTLAEQPKPWRSEPAGISFRYFGGHPLGMLLGCVRAESGSTGGNDDSMLDITTIGAGREFKPEITGTLYLRLNDAWNSLEDNRGQAKVVIRHAKKP